MRKEKHLVTILYEGKKYYWEHLGMLSLLEYREDWARKEKWYEDNGYLKDLIISKDGADGSINSQEVENEAKKRILEQYQ